MPSNSSNNFIELDCSVHRGSEESTVCISFSFINMKSKELVSTEEMEYMGRI